MTKRNWISHDVLRRSSRRPSGVRTMKGSKPGTVVHTLEPAPVVETEQPNIDTTELFRRKNYRVE